MVRRALRSRSLRKIKRVGPSGKLKIHYERRRPEKAKCSNCKSELSGVPRLRQAKLSKMGKSRHKPSRMYGGTLCPSCTRVEIKRRFL
ncbi:MAG: 50S ribosomal protein L34e [Candidatus Aenigmarchaeota archaeon]|nr:50S ribosomal protein L34e [Candidatus Aenigmarchaeota archaeon]